MKTSVALFCAAFVSGIAFADPYSMAIQQAHRAVNQTEAASQGNQPQSSQPAQPPSPAQTPPPVNPALEATLQNIAALRMDFENFKSNPTNKQPLINDLTAAAQGAKPSSKTIAKLADDLTAAIATNEKLLSPQPKLAQEVHAIFNSSHLSTAQQETMFTNAQKILQNGGAAADDITNVLNDLKTIAAETK